MSQPRLENETVPFWVPLVIFPARDSGGRGLGRRRMKTSPAAWAEHTSGAATERHQQNASAFC